MNRISPSTVERPSAAATSTFANDPVRARNGATRSSAHAGTFSRRSSEAPTVRVNPGSPRVGAAPPKRSLEVPRVLPSWPHGSDLIFLHDNRDYTAIFQRAFAASRALADGTQQHLARTIAEHTRQAQEIAQGSSSLGHGSDHIAWRRLAAVAAGGGGALEDLLDFHTKLFTLLPSTESLEALLPGPDPVAATTLALLRRCVRAAPQLAGQQAVLDVKAVLACFVRGGFASAVFCATLLTAHRDRPLTLTQTACRTRATSASPRPSASIVTLAAPAVTLAGHAPRDRAAHHQARSPSPAVVSHAMLRVDEDARLFLAELEAELASYEAPRALHVPPSTASLGRDTSNFQADAIHHRRPPSPRAQLTSEPHPVARERELAPGKRPRDEDPLPASYRSRH